MNKAVMAQLSADLLKPPTFLSAALVSRNPVELSTVLCAASVSLSGASPWQRWSAKNEMCSIKSKKESSRNQAAAIVN
jgi:hypothetical protein